MRVISGKARGAKLKTIESNLTRPTLDRVKESLFNILQNKLKDAIILDLFAGSGALGIEALSRGARKAYFCDKNSQAIEIIKQNLIKTKFLEQSKIINTDYKKCLEQLDEKIDVVFIDAPYKDDLSIDSVKRIIEKGILTTGGIMIVETDEISRDKKEIEDIKGIKIIDQRKYGRANLIFIKEENWYGNFYIIRIIRGLNRKQ